MSSVHTDDDDLTWIMDTGWMTGNVFSQIGFGFGFRLHRLALLARPQAWFQTSLLLDHGEMSMKSPIPQQQRVWRDRKPVRLQACLIEALRHQDYDAERA